MNILNKQGNRSRIVINLQPPEFSGGFLFNEMGATMAGKTVQITKFDKRLGRLIVMHRMGHGLAQKDLARALGCSFQQIQKYENADNRMSASRLYDLCRYLRIPMSTFLQEADAEYLHNPKMARIIQNLYTMSPTHVDLILELTNSLRVAPRFCNNETDA